MNIDRVLQRTRAYMDERRLTERRRILQSIGENIGNELSRNRIELLSRTRAELARIQIDDEYGRGYKEAAQDILFSYEQAIRSSI